VLHSNTGIEHNHKRTLAPTHCCNNEDRKHTSIHGTL